MTLIYLVLNGRHEIQIPPEVRTVLEDAHSLAEDALGLLEAERERTRVLEEALRFYGFTCRDGLAEFSEDYGERARAALASLAAVAVEDEGKGLGYETSSARPVPAGQFSDAVVERVAEVLWVDAGGDPAGSDGRYPWDRDFPSTQERWRRTARAALKAAGTEAAEPPHDPKERT